MTTYSAIERGRYIIFLADGFECNRCPKQDYIGYDAALDIDAINQDLTAMCQSGDRAVKMTLWE